MTTGGTVAPTSLTGNTEDLSLPTDMGAVYILLGCLSLSAVVILGILVYCTSQCWRRRCFKIQTACVRKSSVKLLSAPDDGYLMLKHSRPKMNGAAANCSKEPVSPAKEKLLNANIYYYSCNNDIDPKLGDAEDPDGSVQFGLQPDCELGYAKSHQNGDQSNKSVLHYELGYEKANLSCFRGSLTFALRYDYIHRVLMLHVIKAAHLPAKDRSTTADPYVKMYLLPDRRNHCKTRINKKTLDPEFNEMFSFEADYGSLTTRMLQFTVYDFDRFSRHDLIGNVIMRDLFEKSDLYTWTEYTMHIIASNDKDDFGDLLLYITYEPDESRVTFTIAKAYNLRPMDITGASDPYVKIYQLNGKKRVRAKKTSKKKGNLNPVYNETLTFELSEAQVDSTNFLVKVMDWDRIGSDDLLGCTVIGLESPTVEGKDQWRQVLTAPNQSIGRWHAILADVPDDFCNLTK